MTKKKIFITLFIIIILLITSTVLISRYVSTKGLKVIETSIVDKNLPDSFNGFKIVQFADIHYGTTTDLKSIKHMVDEINHINADIIIFTGDLLDKDIIVSQDDITLIKEELKKIDSNIAKFAVMGNDDYSNLTDVETVFKYADFTILNDMNELIFYKGLVPIKIAGVNSILENEIDLNKTFENSEYENDIFTILISHEPNVINQISDYNVNVLLTSHSLGGLVNIPFVGGIIKFKGSDNYLKGYYKVNNTKMYVNSGIGTSKYNFRLLNKPSINLYRLYNY